MSLDEIKAGDQVTRMLAGVIEMPLLVTRVTSTEIECGPWIFDRRTGAEIDDVLDWGPERQHTGSFIK